jgi:hypothetical protein
MENKVKAGAAGAGWYRRYLKGEGSRYSSNVWMLRGVWKRGAADSYSLCVRDQLQDITNPLLQECRQYTKCFSFVLICSLLNDAIVNADCTESNGSMMVNNELRRMWKWSFPKLEYQPDIWLRGRRKTTKTLRIIGVPAEFQTGHISNPNQKRYFLSRLLRYQVFNFFLLDYFISSKSMLLKHAYGSEVV